MEQFPLWQNRTILATMLQCGPQSRMTSLLMLTSPWTLLLHPGGSAKTRKKGAQVILPAHAQSEDTRVWCRVWLKAFSSPEGALLLFSTKNRNLCPYQIFWTWEECLFCILSQSDLPQLTESPWNADFWCFCACWDNGVRAEVAILGADQKDPSQPWMRMD